MTEPETTCKGFEVNHLVKQYANADKPVLDDISFKVEHGSVLVVLGPSGSGKSTLLRTIAGLEPIQGGTISINISPGATTPPTVKTFSPTTRPLDGARTTDCVNRSRVANRRGCNSSSRT